MAAYYKTLAIFVVLVAAASAINIARQNAQQGEQQYHNNNDQQLYSNNNQQYNNQQYNHGHHEIEYTHHPKYKYEYGVEDSKTHDVKKHSEQRDGDKTEGEYSFHEADGTIRTVKYYVDGKSGFVATVHRTGKAVHPSPVPHHADYKESH